MSFWLGQNPSSKHMSETTYRKERFRTSRNDRLTYTLSFVLQLQESFNNHDNLYNLF